uniref:PI3K/PI4K catalytic domain-containing protein n=1 Tax=Fagus sylvatica TaxID=28930 RepID=A0A2N9F5D1_FAGSY
MESPEITRAFHASADICHKASDSNKLVETKRKLTWWDRVSPDETCMRVEDDLETPISRGPLLKNPRSQAMHVFIDLGSHKPIIVPPNRPNDNSSMVAKISGLTPIHRTTLLKSEQHKESSILTVDENSALLQQLPHWAACSITQALEFLTPAYKGHPRVMAYVLRVLESYPPERVTFFMPQLVQALRYDEENQGKMLYLERELEKIELEGEDLYLPTATNKLVKGIRVDSGIPLQSAAKVPIMITFNVVDRNGDHNDIKPQACIFKDVLALQVIALLRDIFEAVGLNLYLFPYGVLPTGPERGIIEFLHWNGTWTIAKL